MNKEMKGLLQEGFHLQAEIKRLRSGKIVKGKDKGTRIPTVPPSPVSVGVEV